MAFFHHSAAAKSRVAAFASDGFVTLFKNRSWTEFALYLLLAITCLGIAIAVATLLYPIDTLVAGPVENGWYETIQIGILGLTGLVVLRLALTSRHEIFYFSACLAMLIPLAMVRETPRCGSPFYDGGACLTSDGKFLIVSLSISVVVAILSVRRVPMAKSWNELTFFYAIPAVLTALMLLGSEMVLKLPSAWIAGIFVWLEETLELAAYLNLLGFVIALSLKPRWFTTDLSKNQPR
ncbi:hypothetical protein [Fulvimarina sp. MAC3]|uniref:hypothetical protein n=1 Tax=Fulvimarina sp. MAC3 TaxID=3148887 RepID=UPI0031FCC04A